MLPLDLSFACGHYDRTRALADGRVRIPGVELRYLALEPEEIFFRMVRHQEFDVCEMSLSTYLLSHAADGPFVAVPIFPSRSFRHSAIYVAPGSDLIGQPSALAGSRVGLAEYQLTANVWIRGILQEHYEVPVGSVQYCVGGLTSPGRKEKFRISLPPEISVEPVPDGRTLSQMLRDGELQAIYSPRSPEGAGPNAAARIFPDTRAEERRYFEKTGIFPIMHVLVMHRRVYDAHPWLAQELVKACTHAKELALEDLARTAALSTTLPWVREEFEETRNLLGPDYWSYGVDANRGVLTTFIRYAHEQGMIEHRISPEELFAPETRETVVI